MKETHSQSSNWFCDGSRMLLLSIISHRAREGWDLHMPPSLFDMSILLSSPSMILRCPLDYELAFSPVGRHQ